MPRKMETLDLTEKPLSPKTRKSYRGFLTLFDAWRKDRPVNDETLSEYVFDMHEKGKAPGTAKAALAAIVWRCLSEDQPDPRGRKSRAAIAHVKRLGIGRGYGQVDGLKWEQVDLITALATQERTIYGYREAAIYSVMCDALLRIGEASAIDVEHLDFDAQTLFIPRSKTDQEGIGVFLWLRPLTLEYVRRWLEKGKVESGPLFRPIQKDFLRALKKRLGPWIIRYNLQVRCKAAGIDSSRISGHSIRVGSAQSLAQRGATLVEMQQVGRWKSPSMPAHYAQKFIAQQSAMARLRG